MPQVKNLPQNIYKPEALRKPRILHSGHVLLLGIIMTWMVLLLTTHLFAAAMGFSTSLYGPSDPNEMAAHLDYLWKALLGAAGLSIPVGYYIAQQPKTESARFYIGLGMLCAPLAAIVWTFAQPVKYPFFQFAFWAYFYHDAPELQGALVESVLTAFGITAASLVPVWLAFGRSEWILSDAFGSASWGDGLWFAQGPPQTRLGKKLSRAEDRGFPIGWKDGRMLYDRSGLHKLVIAPTGAGKSTGFVIPALLTHPGSAFVIDIKRELFHVTARRRHEINGTVHRLDPFGDNTAQYNPLDLIHTEEGNDTTALDDARRIAHMLVIESGKESNPFFPRSARQMVTGLILYVAAKYSDEDRHRRHLGEVRDLLMQSDEALKEHFKEQMGGKEPNIQNTEGVGESVLRQIIEKGNQFAGLDSREFSAVVATAREQTAFLASTPVRKTLENTTVSFADMKATGSGATFYIVLPEERLETYSRWLRLMIVSAMTETLRVPGKPDDSILFMIDEFPALKRFDELAGGLARHRSAGIQYVLVCQSDNQIKEHYRDTADSIRGNTQCQFMWAPNTREAQEMISSRAGKMTVAVEGATQNMSRSHGGREGSNKSVSRSIQERERPLVTPDEAGRLPSEYAFVFTRHQKPLVIRRPNYVTDELFQQHADPHPSYSPAKAFQEAEVYRRKHGIGFVGVGEGETSTDAELGGNDHLGTPEFEFAWSSDPSGDGAPDAQRAAGDGIGEKGYKPAWQNQRQAGLHRLNTPQPAGEGEHPPDARASSEEDASPSGESSADDDEEQGSSAKGQSGGEEEKKTARKRRPKRDRTSRAEKENEGKGAVQNARSPKGLSSSGQGGPAGGGRRLDHDETISDPGQLGSGSAADPAQFGMGGILGDNIIEAKDAPGFIQARGEAAPKPGGRTFPTRRREEEHEGLGEPASNKAEGRLAALYRSERERAPRPQYLDRPTHWEEDLSGPLAERDIVGVAASDEAPAPDNENSPQATSRSEGGEDRSADKGHSNRFYNF